MSSGTKGRLMLAAPLVSSLMLLAYPAAAGDWSRFRGPNGSGVSTSRGLPVEMAPGKNMSWEADVPFGRSSPVIAGKRIFLTAVSEGKLITLALDRRSGRTIWSRSLAPTRPAELYHDTDSATPSPVTDGSNVYAFFHEAGLVSYDRKGNERFRVPLGPFRNYYGIASSPVLAGNKLLMLCDQAQGSFVLAVDKDSGRELWRRNRPGRLESYATPILYPDARKPKALLISGSRWVDAYDLKDGRDVWTLGGVGTGPISSPVLVGEMLFVNAHDHVEDGWADFGELAGEHDADGDGSLSKAEVAEVWIGRHFGWLDNDADGAISAADWKAIRDEVVNDNWGVYAIRVPQAGGEAETLWNYRQNVPYVPSPLVHDGVFYMVKDGIVTSLDPDTGELLKRGRLGDISAKVYASPIAADGKLYIGTLGGELAVLEAGAQWSVLEINELGGEIWSTPAIADGHLYVRTRDKLYAFKAGGR